MGLIRAAGRSARQALSDKSTALILPAIQMRLALLEPFFTGSHRRWANDLVRFSSHEWTLYTLPGVHWKWRMHGASLSLFRQIEPHLDEIDGILATDMMDLAVLRGLLHQSGKHIPCAIYFHENQLVYPWSPGDKDVVLQRDRHYAFINYTSALTADRVFFNSFYHRNSFLGALPKFLAEFPDQTHPDSIRQIESKSDILYPGIDLSEIAQWQVPKEAGPPIIVWNHRWEFDKNPELFFHSLYQLSDEGIPFRLVVMGESFPASPPVFAEAKIRLARHILFWGYCPGREDYLKWLWRAHLLPVTSNQDFFGYSVAEALACGVRAILPDRLAYPEHHSDQCQYYADDRDLLTILRTALTSGMSARLPGDLSSPFDWNILSGQYDDRFGDWINEYAG
jgi:glycosyltransferase involved in cell wall biosynthesis